MLVVAGGVSLAVAREQADGLVSLPAPALFLLAAAVASDLFPRSRDALSIQEVERIGVVALIVILFDGGMHVGWRRFRRVDRPDRRARRARHVRDRRLIIAVAAHVLFGFDVGDRRASSAPPSPRPTPRSCSRCSGNREVRGRTRHDPRGRVGRERPGRDRADDRDARVRDPRRLVTSAVVGEFSVEMVVGTRGGRRRRGRAAAADAPRLAAERGALPVRDARGRRRHLRRRRRSRTVGLPRRLRRRTADRRRPRAATRREIERFHKALASLAEIAVFVALGLTIDVTEVFSGDDWLDGAACSRSCCMFVARPVVVGALLLPVRLRLGERLFVDVGRPEGRRPDSPRGASRCWPRSDEADRIYEIVFVVVAFSVLVQGSTRRRPPRARLRRADADDRARALGHLGPAAEGAGRRPPLRRRGRARAPPGRRSATCRSPSARGS